MSRILRTTAVAFGLLGGAVASQAPEFSQQYVQRVGGGIDELRRVVQRFDTDAQANGLTRNDAIAQLRGSADDLVSRQGVAVKANVERLERLERHQQDLAAAGPFARTALMFRDGDTDILRAAYQDFQPAMPLTEEGLLSAAIGFVAAWGGLTLLFGFIRSLVRRRQPKRVARA